MKNVKFVFALVLALALGFNSNAQSAVLVADAHIAEDGGKKMTTNGAAIVSIAQEGMVITSQNGKYGFANKQGVDVVFPRYDEVNLFSNNYAAVRSQEGWLFINKQGKKITQRAYDWVGNFSEAGYAPVQINGKWGFINEQGQEITELKYDKVRNFDQNGQAFAKINGKWLIINENGLEVPASQDEEINQANLERALKL